jgi:Cu(I)/Ag(I) efflux system membrane fusion protein
MQIQWKKQAELLAESSQNIQNTLDIASQRAAFHNLSKALLTVLKNYGPFKITLYQQHCPMAFGSKGGEWLSDSPDILNPYLGSNMPKCGINKEKIDI